MNANTNISIERYVTQERLGPYLAETGGDFAQAEALYIWNLRVAGAFHEALGIFEIVLRNALCEHLRTWHTNRPGSWLDDPRGVLENKRIDQIDAARQLLIARGKPVTEGRIVAELSLGFWRYLLARRYEHALWTPHLRRAFPHMKPARRETVYQRVDDLHSLRNRVAHHEPIHHHNLARSHHDMLQLVSWINPDMAAWLEGISRVTDVIAQRPAIADTARNPPSLDRPD